MNTFLGAVAVSVTAAILTELFTDVQVLRYVLGGLCYVVYKIGGPIICI